MAGEKDIIDAAMSNDDYDYGDREPISQSQNDTGNENNEVQGELPLEQNNNAEVDSNTLLDPQPKFKEPVQGQDQQQQPIQQQQRPNDPANPLGLKRVGAQFADGKGNIVDKDGKIVARAGEAARLWQEASRATAQVNNLTRQNAQMTREIESTRAIIAQAKEIAELPQKLGVSREDYNEGITLMSKWRANPVEVAREIVARTLTFGYNVSDILGKSAGDALEMKAVTQLVNQVTAPQRQQMEATARQAEIQRVAEQNYTQFTEKYPDAETHGEAIARQMTKGVNPEVAYLNLKAFALENGFNFAEPLGPQIAARQNGHQQQSQGQRPTEQYRAPMVNGGGRVSQQQVTTQPELANPDDDWGSILSTVMQRTS